MLKQLIFVSIATLLFSAPIFAQQSKPDSVDLSQYRWEKRVLLIFSPDSTQRLYQEQLRIFSNQRAGFEERDLILFHLFGEGRGKLTNQALGEDIVQKLYGKFGINNTEFTVILIGKDGTEKLRTTNLLPVDKLFSVIDAMPMRQREMNNRQK